MSDASPRSFAMLGRVATPLGLARRSGAARFVQHGLFAAAWVIAAIALYKVTIPRPFDVLDFSEFLPILQRDDHFVGKVVGLSEYYARQGRASILGYALLALKWELFGTSAIWWQAVRAFQMAAIALLLYRLLVRWGASRLGACVASTLPLCARVAAPAWTRLNMAEPVCTMLLLGGFLIASDFNAAKPHRTRLIVLLTALVVAIGLLKEVLLVLLPAIWCVAAMRLADGRWVLRRPSRAHLALFATTGGAALLCGAISIQVATQASPDAYATLYGSRGIDPGFLPISYLILAIPFIPFGTTAPGATVLATVAYTFLVISGWRALRGGSPADATHALLLCFALLLPLVGSLVYLPWPNSQAFYGLPFLLGSAILVSFAVTGLETHVQSGRSIALVAWIIVVLVMLPGAHKHSRYAEAELLTAHEVARMLPKLGGPDSLIFATRQLPAMAWIARGETIRRQAAIGGVRLPPTREALCDEVESLLRAPRTTEHAVVVFFSQCGPISQPTVRIVHRYSSFDLQRVGIVQDSLGADIVMP